MFDNIIFANKHLQIIVEDDVVYVKVLEKGYEIQAFNKVLAEFPRVKLTEFIALKTALAGGQSKYVSIGELRPVVELSVSSDRLTACAILNVTDSDFDSTDKKIYVEKILNMCNQVGIVFGIDIQKLIAHLTPRVKFEIAFGQLPAKGQDAAITYYEIKELQPEIIQDGKVNHYELNLINKVQKGEWVGHRIEPTSGIPGKTVYGEVIPAQKGRQEALKYDRKTIEEVVVDGGLKTELRSKQIGAVVIEHDVISVCNYLEIDGHVSFETGNIDFDGFVEVKESIEDNFSVVADNDIQVMGKMGVGSVDTIESKGGNIYIRGGIAGKNKAKIICNGDLYTKFAADCEIVCTGTVNIGFYALNCHIKAQEVVLESFNSKIIGGEIETKIRVIASEIGSKADVYTKISVEGFDKPDMKDQYDKINLLIDKTKERIAYIKQQINIYTGKDMDDGELEVYHKLEDELEKNKKNLNRFYYQRKKYISFLQTRGEGEITASKLMHRNVHVKIKDRVEHMMEDRPRSRTYYFNRGEIVCE